MASLISSLVQALDTDARSSLVHNLQDNITTNEFDDQTPQLVEALAETVALLDSNDWKVCADIF